MQVVELGLFFWNLECQVLDKGRTFYMLIPYMTVIVTPFISRDPAVDCDRDATCLVLLESPLSGLSQYGLRLEDAKVNKRTKGVICQTLPPKGVKYEF